MRAAWCVAKRCSRSNKSYLVNFQWNGPGFLLVSSSYSQIRNSNSVKSAESFGVRTLRCGSEKYTSTWLSQLALTGVYFKRRELVGVTRLGRGFMERGRPGRSWVGALRDGFARRNQSEERPGRPRSIEPSQQRNS